MLITEKKIVKTMVKLDKDEKDILRKANEILFYIQDMMAENNTSEMINLSIEEVIEHNELLRLRAVIGWLLFNDNWELK